MKTKARHVLEGENRADPDYFKTKWFNRVKNCSVGAIFDYEFQSAAFRRRRRVGIY